jgi:hypothetical protein
MATQILGDARRRNCSGDLQTAGWRSWLPVIIDERAIRPARPVPQALPTLRRPDAVARLIAGVYGGSRVKDQESYLIGNEATEQSRFPQLLVGGEKDTSLWGVFAPTQGGC